MLLFLTRVLDGPPSAGGRSSQVRGQSAGEEGPGPALRAGLKEGIFITQRELTRNHWSWLEGKGGVRKGIRLEKTPGLI